MFMPVYFQGALPDELALFVVACVLRRHIAVICSDTIWYTSKADNYMGTQLKLLLTGSKLVVVHDGGDYWGGVFLPDMAGSVPDPMPNAGEAPAPRIAPTRGPKVKTGRRHPQASTPAVGGPAVPGPRPQTARKSMRRTTETPAPQYIPSMHTCHSCMRRYQDKGHYIKHMQKHGKNFPCAKCDTVCTTHQSKKRHMTTQHSNRPNRFPCGDCPMSFTSNSLLQKHSVSHAVVPVHYTCHCGKSYTSKYCLKRHVAVHSAPLQRCPYKDSQGCTYNTRDDRLFEVHVKYHDYSDDEYQCQCGHTCKSRERMQHHKKEDGCARYHWRK